MDACEEDTEEAVCESLSAEDGCGAVWSGWVRPAVHIVKGDLYLDPKVGIGDKAIGLAVLLQR